MFGGYGSCCPGYHEGDFANGIWPFCQKFPGGGQFGGGGVGFPAGISLLENVWESRELYQFRVVKTTKLC